MEQKVERFRRHVRATNVTKEAEVRRTPEEVHEFIVKRDFTESVPNSRLFLQCTLTIFMSHVKDVYQNLKYYLRTTMPTIDCKTLPLCL